MLDDYWWQFWSDAFFYSMNSIISKGEKTSSVGIPKVWKITGPLLSYQYLFSSDCGGVFGGKLWPAVVSFEHQASTAFLLLLVCHVYSTTKVIACSSGIVYGDIHLNYHILPTGLWQFILENMLDLFQIVQSLKSTPALQTRSDLPSVLTLAAT